MTSLDKIQQILDKAYDTDLMKDLFPQDFIKWKHVAKNYPFGIYLLERGWRFDLVLPFIQIDMIIINLAERSRNDNLLYIGLRDEIGRNHYIWFIKNCWCDSENYKNEWVQWYKRYKRYYK